MSTPPSPATHLWLRHSVRMYLASDLASAARPAIAIPMLLSSLKTFFCGEAISFGARLRAAITTWVPLRSPSDAPPCFTASMAYSTLVCSARRFGVQIKTKEHIFFKHLKSRWFLLWHIVTRLKLISSSLPSLKPAHCSFVSCDNSIPMDTYTAMRVRRS